MTKHLYPVVAHWVEAMLGTYWEVCFTQDLCCLPLSERQITSGRDQLFVSVRGGTGRNAGEMLKREHWRAYSWLLRFESPRGPLHSWQAVKTGDTLAGFLNAAARHYQLKLLNKYSQPGCCLLRPIQ
ncbi:hypothetical protein MPTK1_7g00260 [Marchantia polymorpha subsp. ruderalis]|nr:hypothetical protein MARPO_0046s0098 [Marchantia polymorpha]PTQ39286.1 hypothetical protein MARPO_0046s0098 [Marchantia polymorpha]BBN15721.1 hypothetical protein Mp_7g00260 [Marchantia polymorpha subsp. ruderalis]BBN15722.1 hypothetical protein Mp_7g00260 [Marchantia polymorpha subsp. ruderalis]|eukprot:PTQ39285.1 hypothetical protein MARPO_0046s0098 [Marchantia polymorpha]